MQISSLPIGATPKLVTVFGGSGFVGRYVVRALAERGYLVRVAVRRPDLAFHLQPLGRMGQIKAVQANLRYRDSVDAAVSGAHYVINLVGVLQEGGKQNFNSVHEFGARAAAEAARGAGAKLVHVSAIGADENSPAHYGQSKAAGERAVQETIKSAVIMRPSIIFGQEDGFFNRFAAMAQLSPMIPLIGGGHTKFQPVYVGDVADAIVAAVDGKASAGKTYELGGPEVLSFRDCMELMMEQTGRHRMLVHLPWSVARVLGKMLGWLPGAPITSDQVALLEVDIHINDVQAVEVSG